jgi:fructokinase
MNPIVGIGELLWDVFPDGRKAAGGAPFNFAFHCHQLGHPAVIVSRVGDDDLGRELRDEVRRLGLSDEYIQTDPDHPTGTVRVTVDAAGQPSYTITENVAWDYIEFGSQLAFLSEYALAISYGTLAQRAPVSHRSIYEFLTSSRASMRVFDVNLRGNAVGFAVDPEVLSRSFRRADCVKFNDQECEAFLKSGPAEGTELQRLWVVLTTWGYTRYFVIVTRGDGGCRIILTGPQPSEMALDIPGVPAIVVDTVGAGDAFTAAMVCLHLEGRTLRDCARFANHYAARVCEHQGATPRIDRADVERAAFGSSGGTP